jgi:hypothetical protein
LIAGSTIHSHSLNIRNDQMAGVHGDILRELPQCKEIASGLDRCACYNGSVDKHSTHYVARIGYGGSGYSHIKGQRKIALGLTASFKEAKALDSRLKLRRSKSKSVPQ